MKYGCLMRDKMILRVMVLKNRISVFIRPNAFPTPEDPIELNLNVSLSWKMKWNVFLSGVLGTYKNMWCEVSEHSTNLGGCLH